MQKIYKISKIEKSLEYVQYKVIFNSHFFNHVHKSLQSIHNMNSFLLFSTVLKSKKL